MMSLTRLLRVTCGFLIMVVCFACAVMGQTETATVSGLVTDSSGAVVPGAEVQLQSVEQGTVTTATTNNAGIYVFASVKPGQYQVTVRKAGFKQVDLLGLIVNVQDHIEQNFRLQVGSVAESVTVNANDLHINTTDAAVSTVVDRQFAENIPLNGRSFQTLIQLTPGVVLTPTNALDSGQFSVNGQRATSNYWMVDGVSANIGTTSLNFPGNGMGGSLGAFNVLGGTNSLVSVDALQEFRILTSTYAPEFGRTPGGQISILTRSGANKFHGAAFDYFRNDVLDANDWFANATKQPKPEERQNDFGGTFSGPILRDRTFFFFSYEGLRLRLPEVGESTVPSVSARQAATSTMQPFLNAYPIPNGPDLGNGLAAFNASFSNRSTLDAYSLRIDHALSKKLNVFGRYNYSPSSLVQRSGGDTLNTVFDRSITVHTGTIGATWTKSPEIANDLRFNYSRANATGSSSLDTFGGAVVPSFSSLLPSPFTLQNAQFGSGFFGGSDVFYLVGKTGNNLQRQFNVVDTLSVQRGSHSLKFGIDFRRLSPVFNPYVYSQEAVFASVPSAENGNLAISFIAAGTGATLLFRNLGVYGQDTWRVRPRMTVTYGLRWDVDFAPSSLSGPKLLAATGFDLNDLSKLALAPTGTPPFETRYGNVAPRIGIAYQLSQSQDWATVLRGGFGVFYDLATSEVGNTFSSNYPFSAFHLNFGGMFPLNSTTAAPPPITVAELSSSSGTFFAFDPHLRLPYTLQWNAAVEQALGKQQTITFTYVGSAGKRLIETSFIVAPNPNFGHADLIGNSATSEYNALQVQFQRRLSHGLQALASYVLAHSIDDASAGSLGSAANALVPGINPNANRGPSDFDIRNALSAGVTYDIPAPKINTFTNTILHGWSLQNIIQARSAPPVNAYDSMFTFLLNAEASVRPDVVSGAPLYLYGSQYPGGKIFNNTVDPSRPGCLGPFCPPPTNSSGIPIRQGDLGRNALRGFAAAQWDFAVHRDFPIRESVRLQFRAEMFNVLNHPNFGPPVADLNNTAQFGFSTQMLGQSLAGGVLGTGSFDPLYQIGGPRSIQLALKLQF